MAPQTISWPLTVPSIFLAGSIEQGLAPDWQKDIIKVLDGPGICLLNPRRAYWQADLEQSPDNPIFREQVDWELEALERADLVLMHFAAETMSPVSLLEMGLYARSLAFDNLPKLIISCSPDFWRAGNVQITAQRYGLVVHAQLEKALAEIKNRLKSMA